MKDRFIIYSCPHYGLCGQPLVTGECMPRCIKLYDNEAPEIEPKQVWISAKVRPPKVGEEVLVYWDDGFEIGSYTGGEVGEGVYWMPLPDPPKEGE